jgi:hypothetical protein
MSPSESFPVAFTLRSAICCSFPEVYVYGKIIIALPFIGEIINNELVIRSIDQDISVCHLAKEGKILMNNRKMQKKYYLRLKDATKDLFDMFGSLKAAAEHTRVDHRILSEYQRKEREERFIPVDVVIDLENEVSEPIVTRIIAEISGHYLPKIVKPEPDGSVNWAWKLGHATKEFGDVQIGMGKALEDDYIDLDEANELLKEIRGAMTKLLDIKVHLEHHIDHWHEQDGLHPGAKSGLKIVPEAQ